MSHHLELAWAGWGDAELAAPLSPSLRTLAVTALGLSGHSRPAPDIAELSPPLSRLHAHASAEFAEVIGDEHVLTGDADRLRHLRGRSTPDLLRARAGDVADAPDAVLCPADHDEVLALLKIAAARHVAVVPFGGGTSVVGGLAPTAAGCAACVAIDLGRLDRVLAVDETSRTATLEPGLRGPELESQLGARGFTLGHFPQSFEYATVGGFAAARGSGQASAGYGRFDDRVVGLRVATPQGTLVCGTAPKSAAGPDIRQLILGSEGAFGVITAVTVEVSPAPAARRYEGWRFPDFDAGSRALRTLAQDGPRPTVLRLSDEVETALNLARPDEVGGPAGPEAGGCLAIVGFEGTADDVSARAARTAEILAGLGGAPDSAAGPAWEAGRYAAPYLRDALLDAGATVETLETAGFWSQLPALYAAVRDAITGALDRGGTPGLVLCHISHVYASGASLYFTVACRQGEDPVAHWAAIKAAACDAITEVGGTISHHHGVGTEHRPWLEREIGPLGVGVLRAVKSALDPAGIMNPGVLVP